MALRSYGAPQCATDLKTTYAWREEIAGLWRFTRYNGITEGLHSKMEVLQRQAYGFRNFQNYRLRVKGVAELSQRREPARRSKAMSHRKRRASWTIPGIKKSRTVEVGNLSNMLAMASPPPPVLEGLLVNPAENEKRPKALCPGGLAVALMSLWRMSIPNLRHACHSAISRLAVFSNYAPDE